MIRLNQTLMLEEQIGQDLIQECDMQAAYELETAESDEMQYMAALGEEGDQVEDSIPPCDHLGRWVRLRTSGLGGRPLGRSAHAASSSSSSAAAAPIPVHGQEDHQVVPGSQDLQGGSPVMMQRVGGLPWTTRLTL